MRHATDTISHRLFAAIVFTFAAYLSFVAPASADVGTILCRLVDTDVYSAGNALATLGVVSVGIGAMLGKVTWQMAITVAVGIGIFVGVTNYTGQSLVSTMTGGKLSGC